MDIVQKYFWEKLFVSIIYIHTYVFVICTVFNEIRSWTTKINEKTNFISSFSFNEFEQQNEEYDLEYDVLL